MPITRTTRAPESPSRHAGWEGPEKSPVRGRCGRMGRFRRGWGGLCLYRGVDRSQRCSLRCNNARARAGACASSRCTVSRAPARCRSSTSSRTRKSSRLKNPSNASSSSWRVRCASGSRTDERAIAQSSSERPVPSNRYHASARSRRIRGEPVPVRSAGSSLSEAALRSSSFPSAAFSWTTSVEIVLTPAPSNRSVTRCPRCPRSISGETPRTTPTPQSGRVGCRRRSPMRNGCSMPLL